MHIIAELHHQIKFHFIYQKYSIVQQVTVMNQRVMYRQMR